jgi:hypothetical protein
VVPAIGWPAALDATPEIDPVCAACGPAAIAEPTPESENVSAIAIRRRIANLLAGAHRVAWK